MELFKMLEQTFLKLYSESKIPQKPMKRILIATCRCGAKLYVWNDGIDNFSSEVEDGIPPCEHEWEI